MRTRKSLFLVCLLGMLSLPAAAMTWDEQVLSALANSRTDEARKVVQRHQDTKRGRILLFAAYAQQYDRTDDAKAISKAKALYRDLLREVAVDDVVLLHELRKLPGSLLHSYTETLMDQALQRIETAEHAQAVPDALAAAFKSERYKIFGALSSWLFEQRERAARDGKLDEVTQSVFLDERLIMVLLDHIEPRKLSPSRRVVTLASPVPPPRDAVTRPPRAGTKHQQPPRTNATARECVILIEEPAVPLIQARLNELGDAGVELLSDICTAKSVRESGDARSGSGSPCGD